MGHVNKCGRDDDDDMILVNRKKDGRTMIIIVKEGERKNGALWSCVGRRRLGAKKFGAP